MSQRAPIITPSDFSIRELLSEAVTHTGIDANDDELLQGDRLERDDGNVEPEFGARMLMAELAVHAKYNGVPRNSSSSNTSNPDDAMSDGYFSDSSLSDITLSDTSRGDADTVDKLDGSSSHLRSASPLNAEPSSEESLTMAAPSSTHPLPLPTVPSASALPLSNSEAELKTSSWRRRQRRLNKMGRSSVPPIPTTTEPTSPRQHPEGSRARRLNRKSTIRQRELKCGLGFKDTAAPSHAAKRHFVKCCIARRRLSAWKAATSFKLSLQLDLRDKATRPGWTCRRPKRTGPDRTRYRPLDLEIRFGTYFIEWNGADCRLLMDRQNKIFGVLAGMPRGDSWQKVHDGAVHAICVARMLLQNLPKKYEEHRRGQYPALSCGISHGGGQLQPSNLHWRRDIAAVISYLLQDPCFQRISGFANCIFRTYAPRLHRYYCDTLDALQEKDPRLVRPFCNTAFAACCFNLGPQTVSYPHRDHANLSWGWCAITALGSFDPTKGGHLILWDLNCAIPLRPAATVLIPSSLLEHSNAAILANEQRFSFVQFSAGGLFRWAENGFQTEAAWRSKATKEEIVMRDANSQLRWLKGLDMLSNIDEFAPPRSAPTP